MIFSASGDEVRVDFGSGEAEHIGKKVATALGYCCAEGVPVVVDSEGVSARLASNANPDSARLLVENVATVHLVEGSSTYVEEAREFVSMPDGMPFVMNR